MTDRRPLDVRADLTIDVDGRTVAVSGEGDLVVVDAPDLSTLRRLGDVAPLDRGAPLRALARGGVAVDLRVRGASVARHGPDEEGGPLARLAGVAPARLHALGVLRALARTDRPDES